MRAFALALLAAVAVALAAAPAALATRVWAVGDGAGAAWTQDDQLAAMIAANGPNAFLYLGDVYPDGTAVDFQLGYEPSFGRLKALTWPTPGNHEYANRAEGYDPYWGTRVVRPDGGHYYSFDLDRWHFVSLDSEEPIGQGSAQLAWLRSDLARYPGTCTIAFEHRPRFSAGPQYNTPALQSAWAALTGHAVALLSGHAHNYQRHRPLRGLTQFVVGTGGAPRGTADAYDPRLAAVDSHDTGAVRLDLQPGRATYSFVALDGVERDRGSLDCATHFPTPVAVRLTRPRSGATYGRLGTVSASVRNARRLRVRLVRRVGRSCWLLRAGGLARADCNTSRSLRVSGRTRLRLRLPLRTLPPGRYRLTVIARGLDDAVYSRTVRFRMRGQ